METLLGWLGLERSGTVSKKLTLLINQQKQIMATNQEFIQQLNDLKAELDTTNTKLTAANDKAVKIGTETAKLLTTITDLKKAIEEGSVSPEVLAAFDAVKTQAGAVGAATGVIDTTLTGVDDQVQDEPTPPPA